MAEAERGWLPDFLFWNGAMRAGLALFADETGHVSRVSSAPADLQAARRLEGRAVLPGLVNAHSHAFQRVIRGRTERRSGHGQDDFWSWREAMYHAANRLSPAEVYTASAMSFLEMLRAGITTVGEFHYLHHAPGGERYSDPGRLSMEVLRAAKDTGIRIVLLETAYARAGWQRPPDALQARFIFESAGDFLRHLDLIRNAAAARFAGDRVQFGVAPHSIRAAPLPYLQEIARYAQSENLPLHMHVAEHEAEVEACLAEYGLPPVALLARHGIIDHRFTAVHATHATGEETRLLGEAQSCICVCPTTERNLGDGIARADRWMEQGVSICLGSDSNVQIDLLEDSRELEYHLRLGQKRRAILTSDSQLEESARGLFECATLQGARSLGTPGGTLEAGSPADFFSVDLSDLSIAGSDRESLLSNIVFAAQRTSIRDVFIAGRPVIEDGRHPLESALAKSFALVQRSIWGNS